MLSNQRSSKRPGRAERRGAGAILDGTLGFVVVILTLAFVAMTRNGFQPEVLLIALAYVAMMLLLARRHGWSVGSYVRRLRAAPTDERGERSGTSG